MAIMHGKNAKIYWDADGSDINLLHGQSWSCDMTHDTAEQTSMQDTWKTYLGGFQGWTATVECLLPKTDTGTVVLGGDDGMGDDECNLELYLVYATNNYKGLYAKAICTGRAMSVDANGVATVSYTFQGSEQLKWHSETTVIAY